ncbi:MAG: RDD family protein [Pyrinomonadaceae bacterium]
MSSFISTEEALIIETPERVPLHFALASIGNRFLACALDHAVQIIAIFLVILVVAAASDVEVVSAKLWDAPKWLQALLILMIFVLWFGYFVVFEWRWNGQTPGKRFLKLRVIRQDGRPITFWEAAVRNLLRSFDMMPAPFYSIGLISVFFSAQDQRFGDMFAGTVVVREREEQAPTFDQVFGMRSEGTDVALRRVQPVAMFTGDIRVLTENEIQVVEAFLRRRWELPHMPRQWMAWRVAIPILYKIKPTLAEQDFTYEGFLEELLHRYRADRRFSD